MGFLKAGSVPERTLLAASWAGVDSAIGSGESVLWSYTVPADTLTAVGEWIEWEWWAKGVASTQDLRTYVDGVQRLSTAIGTSQLEARGRIARRAAGTAGEVYAHRNSGSSTANVHNGAETSIDFTGSFAIEGRTNGGTGSSQARLFGYQVWKVSPA